LRRSDISAKILKDANTTTSGSRTSFQKIFAGAQKVLQDTFGMQLVEMPGREKTSLKERRTQATQTKVSGSSASSKSWVLVSTLPQELKTNPLLIQPSLAPNAEAEANYTALYTFILSLIFLNASAITDQKLERYLKRVNADTYTPVGGKEKLLQRMIKEGYVDKRRDTSSGEEVIEWIPGPRGKVEVGVQGVMGLVRTVYGYGAVELSRGTTATRREGDDEDEEDDEPGRLVKIEEDELNAKLSRSLGIKTGEDAGGERRRHQDGEEEEQQEEDQDDDGQPGPSRRGAQRTRPANAGGRDQGRSRGGRGRNGRDEEDDDDDSG
jgi:hypothetical protein